MTTNSHVPDQGERPDSKSPEVQTLAELVAPVMRAWTLDSPFHDSAPRRVAEALLVAGYMHVAERDALQARVDLLTTALTEIGEKWKALDYDSRCTVYGTNPELVEAMDAVNARAVLSATPTESA